MIQAKKGNFRDSAFTDIAGWGFSNDIQNLVDYDKKACFKGNATHDGTVMIQKQIAGGISHRELETAIGVNASNNKVDWGPFSNQVYGEYLRTADDHVHQLQKSWHYYVYGGHNMNFTLAGKGKDALTFEGKV